MIQYHSNSYNIALKTVILHKATLKQTYLQACKKTNKQKKVNFPIIQATIFKKDHATTNFRYQTAETTTL